MDRVAQRMRELRPRCLVRCAFLELTEPDLSSVAQELHVQGVTRMAVFPMFLGMGRHAREDLPVLVEQLRAQYPGMDIRLMASVGENPLVVDMLAHIALANA